MTTPITTISASRRSFLRQASALSLAGTAAPFALNLASIGAASASTPADYKALVCVFLYGAQRRAQHRRSLRRGRLRDLRRRARRRSPGRRHS